MRRLTAALTTALTALLVAALHLLVLGRGPVAAGARVVRARAVRAVRRVRAGAVRAGAVRTVPARQFAAYAAGGPVPPRSVLLTFDDGTRGLWAYADRIRARHRMHGSAFLITGRTGRTHPYHLTWAEAARMRESGRSMAWPRTRWPPAASPSPPPARTAAPAGRRSGRCG